MSLLCDSTSLCRFDDVVVVVKLFSFSYCSKLNIWDSQLCLGSVPYLLIPFSPERNINPKGLKRRAHQPPIILDDTSSKGEQSGLTRSKNPRGLKNGKKIHHPLCPLSWQRFIPWIIQTGILMKDNISTEIKESTYWSNTQSAMMKNSSVKQNSIRLILPKKEVRNIPFELFSVGR